MTSTEQALSKSVIALDAARRVGWAKAFKAEEMQGCAEKQLNIALADLAIVGRFAALLYGIICEVAPGAEYFVEHDPVAVVSIFPDEYLRKGKKIGGRWLAENRKNLKVVHRVERVNVHEYPDGSPVPESELVKSKTRRRNIWNRAFRAGKEKKVEQFIEDFNFANEAALLNYLALYAGNK